MEVNWAERQLQRYAVEARQIRLHLATGAADDFFVERALHFLNGFLSLPSHSPNYAECLQPVANMAQYVYIYLQPQGRWSEIIHIWPTLAAHLEQHGNWELYARHTIRLTVVANNYLGSQQARQILFKLVNHSCVSTLPPLICLEMWHQYSIYLIELGEYTEANFYLQNATLLCAQNEEDVVPPVPINRTGVRVDVEGTYWQHHGFMLNLLGNIALIHGRYEQAQGYYEQSARVFAKHDANEEFAYSANQSLGRLWLYRQQYAKALPYLLRNYELSHRHAKVQGNATSSCYLAAAYIGLNQLEQAEKLLNSAIRMFNQLQDKSDMAMCHLYFGELESARGNHNAAVAQWQRVLELLRSTQSHMIEQQALAHLMLHHLRAGDIPDSLGACARLLRSLLTQRIQPWSARAL